MQSVRIANWVLFPAMSALLLGAQAFATTYVVDDDGGPGVDFTDLPAAVAAAQPGDVLRVMPGSYSAFICTKGITILGYGGPTVNGAVNLTSIPPGRPVVLAGLSPRDVLIGVCDAPVILQQVSGVDSVLIESSVDVRLLDVHTSGSGSSAGQEGIAINSSRVEIVQSEARGAYFSPSCGYHVQAGHGLQVTLSSRVHFALSEASGAAGSQCYTDYQWAPDGGDGIHLADSELILAGSGHETIRGGYGGFAAWWWVNCYYDGYGGAGVWAPTGQGTYSRVRMQGGTFHSSVNTSFDCYDGHGIHFYAPAITHASPPHSTLSLAGIPTPNQAVHLTLNGAVGSRASIWIGRRWILEPEPNVDIELAVDRQKVIELGAIPESGSITYSLEIPGTYPPGTAYGVQGECLFESGLVRRTNSVPIVVR
jgi:hypothetical protein